MLMFDGVPSIACPKGHPYHIGEVSYHLLILYVTCINTQY